MGRGAGGCPGLQASQPSRERPALHSRGTSEKSGYPTPIVTSGAESVPSVGVKGTGLGHTLGLPTVSVTRYLAPLWGFCVSQLTSSPCRACGGGLSCVPPTSACNVLKPSP